VKIEKKSLKKNNVKGIRLYKTIVTEKKTWGKKVIAKKKFRWGGV